MINLSDGICYESLRFSNNKSSANLYAPPPLYPKPMDSRPILPKTLNIYNQPHQGSANQKENSSELLTFQAEEEEPSKQISKMAGGRDTSKFGNIVSHNNDSTVATHNNTKPNGGQSFLFLDQNEEDLYEMLTSNDIGDPTNDERNKPAYIEDVPFFPLRRIISLDASGKRPFTNSTLYVLAGMFCLGTEEGEINLEEGNVFSKNKLASLENSLKTIKQCILDSTVGIKHMKFIAECLRHYQKLVLTTTTASEECEDERALANYLRCVLDFYFHNSGVKLGANANEAAKKSGGQRSGNNNHEVSMSHSQHPQQIKQHSIQQQYNHNNGQSIQNPANQFAKKGHHRSSSEIQMISMAKSPENPLKRSIIIPGSKDNRNSQGSSRQIKENSSSQRTMHPKDSQRQREQKFVDCSGFDQSYEDHLSISMQQQKGAKQQHASQHFIRKTHSKVSGSQQGLRPSSRNSSSIIVNSSMVDEVLARKEHPGSGVRGPSHRRSESLVIKSPVVFFENEAPTSKGKSNGYSGSIQRLVSPPTPQQSLRYHRSGSVVGISDLDQVRRCHQQQKQNERLRSKNTKESSNNQIEVISNHRMNRAELRKTSHRSQIMSRKVDPPLKETKRPQLSSYLNASDYYSFINESQLQQSNSYIQDPSPSHNYSCILGGPGVGMISPNQSGLLSNKNHYQNNYGKRDSQQSGKYSMLKESTAANRPSSRVPFENLGSRRNSDFMQYFDEFHNYFLQKLENVNAIAKNKEVGGLQEQIHREYREAQAQRYQQYRMGSKKENLTIDTPNVLNSPSEFLS